MRWEMKLAAFLVIASTTIFTLKFLLIGNVESTINYLFNSLGFLPINVLLVTVVLNSLLSVRSKRDKLEKLNMVIGTFFSEVGTDLLTIFSNHDSRLEDIRCDLVVTKDWNEEEFNRIHGCLNGYSYDVDIAGVDLGMLRAFLADKRNFLLRLLENPVLLEHESFTEALRATFHLTDELERRERFMDLPESDLEHIEGDINRVYGLLVQQWLNYMKYMKSNYPYLFSLAMRTNPFDSEASPIVQ